ncbi:DUF7512 family protein [Halorientalis regularis]|uniref:Uncharacterized protein n=1 Tax=Halorientalis regularis TaxID=660518 RepID=A0A1G7SNM4_9EURY|nr:hypothetical protein [Halorientalis regularis]SDG24568.1 hypothetical protein SAMN05216218_11946 [Halorientalis regularis]
MFGLDSLSGNPQAAAFIGIVLIEALVLYVGYGALEQAFGEYVVGLLRDE